MVVVSTYKDLSIIKIRSLAAFMKMDNYTKAVFLVYAWVWMIDLVGHPIDSPLSVSKKQTSKKPT